METDQVKTRTDFRSTKHKPPDDLWPGVGLGGELNNMAWEIWIEHPHGRGLLNLMMDWAQSWNNPLSFFSDSGKQKPTKLLAETQPSLYH